MRFIKVKVTRDTNHSVASEVSPWEVPVLEHLYDAGNVEIVGERDVADRAAPDANDELARLTTRYGKNTDTGVAYVEEVFGRGNQGVKALAALINEENERAAPKKPARTKAGADPLAA